MPWGFKVSVRRGVWQSEHCPPLSEKFLGCQTGTALRFSDPAQPMVKKIVIVRKMAGILAFIAGSRSVLKKVIRPEDNGDILLEKGTFR